MLGVKLVQKKELVLAIRECNMVTSSDVMNFADVSSVPPRVRALPGFQNIALRFLCQT